MDKELNQELENIFSETQENTEIDNTVEAVENSDNINNENDDKVVDEKENITETKSENQEIDNLDKQLSGLSKELIETVKSIKDPEDREKTIKIAREQRAREDRLSLQLGNTKKELNNISGLLQYLQTKPAETFKALAKQVNFNLKDAVEIDDNTVQDELYLTPEELINKKTAEIQQNTHKFLQEEVNRREISEVLADFFENENHKEDLISENKESFNGLFNQELAKEINRKNLDSRDYIPRAVRLEAMKNAYSRLERLQPDYESVIEAKIRQKIEKEKKDKFDEAKKQQKFSKPVANSNYSETFDQKLANIWSKN
jgi:hypothetical protein